MCKICDIAASSPYASKMEEWVKRDIEKVKKHKENGGEAELWSSLKWPLRMNFPIFEPRVPLAVPTNYFQGLSIDSQMQPKKWAHDCTRAIGFKSGRLVVISKFAAKSGFEDTFQSYYLFSAGLDEIESGVEANGSITIRLEKEINFQNLVDGRIEKKQAHFTFSHKPVQNAIVSQEQARTNSRVQQVYGKEGFSLPHSDIEDYFVTVPNFFPHPYLLEQYAQLGYASRREFQIAGPIDYFKAHLKKQ
ncbi:MAG: hypothetical protein WC506_03295 [Candidatus Micrarchaeia archaeon]